MKSLTLTVSDELYEIVQEAFKESGLNYMSEFLRAVLEIMFKSRFDKIEKTDLSWTKYVYVLGLGVQKLLIEYKKAHPEEVATANYLSVMTQGINNFINSIAFSNEYKLSPEDESAYIDAIVMFFMWIERNDLTSYNVKKFGERIKQTLKEG